MIFAYFVNLRAVRLIFRGFVHNMPESTNQNKTFAKKRISKYCNRKSQQGVKDENLAETRLDFTNIVSFEGLNIVFGSFVHNMPESTDQNETFAKNLISKYCNRMSQQGDKDENLAEKRLDFTNIFSFEIFCLKHFFYTVYSILLRVFDAETTFDISF